VGGLGLFASTPECAKLHTCGGPVHLDGANLAGADLAGAVAGFGSTFSGVIYGHTICPDGTHGDADGGTCAGHGL
jgi:hypothetical protein